MKKNSSKFRPKFAKLTDLGKEREKAHVARIFWPVLNVSAQPGVLARSLLDVLCIYTYAAASQIRIRFSPLLIA